jgi:hypothetical protein
MYTCPKTIELVESVLGVKPGQSHTLGLDQLMVQYSVNIALKLDTMVYQSQM